MKKRFANILKGAATVVFIGFAAVGAIWWAGPGRISSPAKPTSSLEVTTIDMLDLYAVGIRRPVDPPSVDSGLRDAAGQPISISCGTCHGTREPNLANRTTADLDLFHQALVMQHGGLACVACHNPERGYDALRLADGSSVAFENVMTLCAQCHGPQFRDYTNGSHGGMTGYWDRTKGPRERNNCIDCHDPHAPKFPMVHPAPGPNDRFLAKDAAHAAE